MYNQLIASYVDKRRTVYISYFIINVGRMLILELPQKQNGHPIGYIMLLTLIHVSRLINGLLLMAKLAKPLMDVRNAGKVQNRKVAKSQIVLIPILILIKKFIARQPSHDTKHCSINKTNKVHLLVGRAFWVEKINGMTI